MPKPATTRPLALVTGASTGIGRELAARLAARGYDLVLTARRAPLLDELATELRGRHPDLTATTVAADLGSPDGAEQVWSGATRAGRAVDLLANNAGFGYYRPFASCEWSRDAELLQLNVVSLVELCHRFVTAALAGDEQRPAHLLNVASIAAYQSIASFANYAASKAYVRNFSEALHDELARTRVRVTCVCPGGTKTPFHEAAGAGNYGKLANASMMEAGEVADIALRALFSGKRVVIPGAINKLSCAGARMVPRAWASRVASWVLGRPRDQPLPARR